MVTACLDFGLFNLFLLTISGITLISDDARICGIEGRTFQVSPECTEVHVRSFIFAPNQSFQGSCAMMFDPVFW